MEKFIDPLLERSLMDAGWQKVASGELGELWNAGDDMLMPVPFSLTSNSRELRAVYVMLARQGKLEFDSPGDATESFYADLTEFRLVGAEPSSHEISLLKFSQASSGVYRLVKSAVESAKIAPSKKLTSIQQKQVLSETRVGLTKPGSYIIPVRLGFAEELNEKMKAAWEDASSDAESTSMPLSVRENYKPSARFASMRLSEILSDVSDIVIQPDRAPSNDDIKALESRRINRNVVAALASLSSESDLDVDIKFAKSILSGRIADQEFSFPRDATQLLDEVSRRLSRRVQLTHRDVEGVITEMSVAESDGGERGQTCHFKLDTPDRRVQNFYLTVYDSEDVDKYHRWFKGNMRLRLVCTTYQAPGGDTTVQDIKLIEPIGGTKVVEGSRVPKVAKRDHLSSEYSE